MLSKLNALDLFLQIMDVPDQLLPDRFCRATIDWAEFSSLLKGLQAPAFCRLCKLEEDLNIPDGLFQSLQRNHAASKLIQRKTLREEEYLAALFESHGIRCLFMKGAALRRLVYKEYGYFRRSSDLDVLIDKADSKRVTEMLIEDGYTFESFLYGKDTHDYSIHLPGFTKYPGFGVDVHTSLIRPTDQRLYYYFHALPPPTEFEDPWANAIPWSGYQCIRILDVPYSLLRIVPEKWYMFFAYNPDFLSPKEIMDTVWILRQSDSLLDWERLIYLAQKLKLAGPLYVWLQMISSLYSDVIDPTNFEGFAPFIPGNLVSYARSSGRLDWLRLLWRDPFDRNFLDNRMGLVW